MASIATHNAATEQSRAAAVTDRVPALTILRLMLPKLGIGYIFAMMTSVYNKVMISDLGIAAMLVGTMFLIYRMMSVTQVMTGRMMDRRAVFGWRRTPFILLGMLIASLALVPLPHAATALAGGNSTMLLALLAIAIVFGFGFAMNGDAHNTLIAEITEGKKNRGGVVAAVWVFTILAGIISGIIVSIVLASAEMRAGAPRGCVSDACLQIKRDVSLQLMPTLFLIGPLVCVVGFLAVLGVERRLNAAELAKAELRPPLELRQAFTRIFANSQARVFFFFVFTAMFGLFLQDIILEPFGADVFKMATSETARLQQIMGIMTIIAMIVVGITSGRRSIAKRAIANWGAVISAVGFVLLALSAALQLQPALYAGLVVLGTGMGVFNIGALSMMMDMTVPGETGSLMGAWGMAQATATGMAQFSAGFMRDAGLVVFGSAPATYALIFGVSVVLCVVALSLMARVNVEKFRKLTREQMGLAIEAA